MHDGILHESMRLHVPEEPVAFDNGRKTGVPMQVGAGAVICRSERRARTRNVLVYSGRQANVRYTALTQGIGRF